MKHMLKIIAVTSALIAVVGFTAPGFAEARGNGAMAAVHAGTYVYVTGAIASVDAAANEVVIKEASGADKTIVVDAKDAATLKAGDKVKVKMKRGTKTAVSITPLVTP